MELQELYDEMAKLLADMQTFLDENENEETGELPAEEAETFAKMEKRMKGLRKKIDRIEKMEAEKAAVNAREEKLAKETAAVMKTAIKPPLTPFNANISGKVGRASDEYKRAMMTALRTNFRQVSNLLEETTAAQGGFLVPAEWDNRLIDTLEEENVMRTLGTRITTEGEHKINIVASKPAAAWVSEGQPITFSNATFDQKTLDAHKLGVGIQVTNELLYDNAFNLESYIIEQFGKALANAEEDAFINGTGSGQPTGLLTTLTADPTTYITTTGASISSDDIINLEYTLKRPYRRQAAWLVNDATLALIRKLKDTTQNYLWQASFTAGEPDRLLGYPIYTSPYMPKAESGNLAVVFGDFSYYNIADRGSRTVKELRELYAVQDISAFLLLERVDACLVQNEAVRALQIK